MIRAAITNRGKYNEGILDFTWLDLPATDEEFNAALDRVGIGHPNAFGIPYEEWFVSDYDDESGLGVSSCLGEYPDQEDLNLAAEYAEELEDADAFELRDFCLDHNLEWEAYGIENVYAADDTALDEMVKEVAEARGFQGMIYFLGQCVKNPTCDYFKLDGYDNLKPCEGFGDDLASARREILSDVLKAV